MPAPTFALDRCEYRFGITDRRSTDLRYTAYPAIACWIGYRPPIIDIGIIMSERGYMSGACVNGVCVPVTNTPRPTRGTVATQQLKRRLDKLNVSLGLACLACIGCPIEGYCKAQWPLGDRRPQWGRGRLNGGHAGTQRCRSYYHLRRRWGGRGWRLEPAVLTRVSTFIAGRNSRRSWCLGGFKR